MRKRHALMLIAIAAAAFVLSACAGAPTKTVSTHSPIPAGRTCADCHAKDKTHLPPYAGPCEKCHSLDSWTAVSYMHADDDFNQALHGTMGCVRCHTEGYPPPSPACSTCHASPHGGWTGCRSCHVPLTWLMTRPLPSGHVSLAGGHAPLKCFDCHAQAQEPAVPRTCVNCHGTHHGGLTDCGRCHDPANGWKPGSFDHNVFFRITGRHTKLTCAQCHPNGRFAGTPANCVGCHGAKHGGLTECARCHTTSGFKPSTFRHSSVFPLSPGPHARLACSRCHPSSLFARVRGTTCVGCHGRVHGMSTCSGCHTASGAVSSRWSHAAFFALTGAHRTLACSRCHGSPFRPAPGKNCVDCHGVHHGNQTACGTCHTTTAWVPIKAITHPAPIRLGVQHASRPCTLCHPTLDFRAAPRPCVDCHAAVIPHVGPSDCVRCHQPTVWSDIHFAHPDVSPHSNTEFPCTDCHVGLNFTLPRSVICGLCHLPF